MKNRRISKIKSKLYHKIKKREKDREEKKLIEYLEQIDPEAAQVYREKDEQKKVEERLRLRHATNNKFAKRLQRFGGMEDKNVRELFNEMVREKNALKRRTKKMGNAEEGSDSEMSGSDEDEDVEMDPREKAIKDIEQEVGENDQDESGDDESSDEDDEIKFDFKSKNNNHTNKKA